MPSIFCSCGTLLDYGLIPSPIEWLAISDVEYDSYVGSIDSDDLYKKMRSILKCPSCGRLWVFWGGFSEKPSVYAPES